MNWGVLISGNGGNLQALMEEVRVTIVLAIPVSGKKAYGVLRARRMGVPVIEAPLELLKKEKKPELEEWIWQNLSKYNVNNVFLAGYMKIVTEGLINKMRSKGLVLNIHPSLLPKYKGLAAFEEAHRAGDRELGLTIHHVVPEVDSGEFLHQRRFGLHQDRHLENSKLWLHMNEQAAIRGTVRRCR